MSFLFINKTLRLNNFKTRTDIDAKMSVFASCVKVIIYLLLYNLHDSTFKTLNNLNPNFMKEIFIFLLIIPIVGMTYLWRIEKQQNMVTKVSELWVHIYGTQCLKNSNLQPQYLYWKILSKLGLDLNLNVNYALSNPPCSSTRTIL